LLGVLIMSYLNKDELRTYIGKVGVFYNADDDKCVTIGTLKSVTKNGNCENDDGTYFDEFRPKTRSEMLELIDLEYYA